MTEYDEIETMKKKIDILANRLTMAEQWIANRIREGIGDHK